MAHIGTPILGDPVYNPKSPKADRMYLHAAMLEITIPEGKRVTFTAPLPESFRDAVK
jgi:23S rRNA pseudouridine1911/1915/1917 synthase